MKIILTTLNSKFIHSNLAIRYLANYTKDINPIEIHEFTINQSTDFIASEIFKMNPDVVGFSVYIWNLRETLKICEILKKVKPDIQIVLGGPEVSFEERSIMEKYEYIDFIISGEGEVTFKEFLSIIVGGKNDFKDIKGLSYRTNGEIVKNEERRLLKELDLIPSPYVNVGREFENKIVYYESSRGCPFECQFCLSSTIQGVRYFSIDRVKEDLANLIDGNVKQVKFVDRTFNANKRYAMEIMSFIMEKNPKNINFHFEVTAHLLDEEMLSFLKNVKEGLFQFEIGVQSTHEETLDAIGRITDFEKLSEVTTRIKSYNNIHQHLDLIAGLPYEDYNTFKKSFNDVYELRPEKLQLGFLKLLKGSGLRLKEKRYGYKYIDEPPYEVLENIYISYDYMIKLKGIEDLVEKYYNEGYFKHTLEFIINNNYLNAFEFYEEFSAYWENKGYHKVSHSRNGLYNILIQFIRDKGYIRYKTIINLLKYDYIFSNKRPKLPQALEVNKDLDFQKNIHNILKSEKLLKDYLWEQRDIPTKKLINRVTIEKFDLNILEIIENGYKPIDEEEDTYILFDHKDGQIIRCYAHDITEIVKGMI